MNKNKIIELKKIANDIRKESLLMIYKAQSGHPGGSLSEADILAALYSYKLRIDAKKPLWAERDRFVLSKGHASPGYYVTLAMKGFFPKKELESYRKINGLLQGHPELNIPGVDYSAIVYEEDENYAKQEGRWKAEEKKKKDAEQAQPEGEK